jgi:type II secretory pathway component PulF
MAERGEQGHAVGDGLDGLASPVVAYLFRQAEARGDLADSCQGIAEYCEDRYEKLSSQILAALEPILIVMLGLIIGTIIVALYMPLFDLPRAHMR